MPQHLTTESKWEKFFQIISGEKTFKVKKVTDDEITIQASAQEIQQMRNLLANKEELQNLIPHLNKNKDANDKQKELSQESNKVPSILESVNFEGLITQLFDTKFLHDQHLSAASFQDNAELQIADLEIKCKTKAEFKRDISSLKMVRSCFSNPSQIIEVLENQRPFSEDTDQKTSFAKKIFEISKNKEAYHGSVKLNYGKLLQTLQNESDTNHTKPPIIACNNENLSEYTINPKQLLGYLQPVLGIKGSNTGIVFGSRDEDGLRDGAMFATSALQALNSNKSTEIPLVHLVLDLSFSMEAGFGLYKSKIKDLVNEITESHSDWRIFITPFSKNILPTAEFTSFSNVVTDIKKYINKLELIGTTNLNGAIFESVKNIESYLVAHPHSTLLIFTDGDDTEKKKTIQEIENNITEIRSQSENFTMITVGYGSSYKAEFFDTLSAKLGLTHAHLNNLDQMQELTQYMQNLCSNKFIFKIITDNERVFMDQVPENDVAILKSKVGDDVIVERAGYQYNMNIGENFNMTFSNLHLADEREIAGNISNNSTEL